MAKKIPGFSFLYETLRRHIGHRVEPESTEEIFLDIYRNNGFGGGSSVSGPGSDVQQTKIIATELPALFHDLKISTMLDVPCGDFHWMKHLDLHNIDYTGADIVNELIQKNRAQYVRDGVRFHYLDLIKDSLPKVDLIFCRDCLVHFSFADIALALDNISNSGSEYLLTTTFTDRTENHDIVTGVWRPINLELAPFELSKPLAIINEGCTENNGVYKDKSLGLWRIADIRESLSRQRAGTLPLRSAAAGERRP